MNLGLANKRVLVTGSSRGIGLAIAKMIAKVYGGKIVVGSTKKGTRVCLKIKVG